MENSSPPSFNERRRFPRIEYSIDVDLGDTPACTNKGRITSLGVGGCFVETELEMAEGGLIFIRLLLAPKSARVMEGVVWGRVAYHAPGRGLGIEFKKLPEDYEEHIRDIVEFHLGNGEDS